MMTLLSSQTRSRPSFRRRPWRSQRHRWGRLWTRNLLRKLIHLAHRWPSYSSSSSSSQFIPHHRRFNLEEVNDPPWPCCCWSMTTIRSDFCQTYTCRGRQYTQTESGLTPGGIIITESSSQHYWLMIDDQSIDHSNGPPRKKAKTSSAFKFRIDRGHRLYTSCSFLSFPHMPCCVYVIVRKNYGNLR